MAAPHISVAAIQKLREETGAGVMECKKALEKGGGDFATAKRILKEQGLLKSQKRAGRETAAGFIAAYVHQGRVGALLHLGAETDFVVNSEPFQKLAKELAMQIVASSAEKIEDLLEEPYIRDPQKTVRQLIQETSAKVGENITIHAFSRLAR